MVIATLTPNIKSEMKKIALFIVFTFLSVAAFSQVRVSRLVVEKGQTYSLGQSDILVADTIIMKDDSRIVLNKLVRENVIRSKVIIVGMNCFIDGTGINGTEGAKGRDGITPQGPCKDGTDGRNGGRGLDGGQGNHLFLYVDELRVNGKLTINLTGGNGGNGGNAGNGGGGGPGTIHCSGGDGGNAGNGGDGGNGGNGGTLEVDCTKCTNIRGLFGRDIIVHYGSGNFGYYGTAGYGGAPGLSPTRKSGKNGLNGVDGVNGKTSEAGTVKFEGN